MSKYCIAASCKFGEKVIWIVGTKDIINSFEWRVQLILTEGYLNKTLTHIIVINVSQFKGYKGRELCLSYESIIVSPINMTRALHTENSLNLNRSISVKIFL